MVSAGDRMARKWLGEVPPMRCEQHYGDRLIRCFLERPRNAYALLEEAVARNPAGEALICGNERLTYRTFEEGVARCATALQALGVRQGDRVALLLSNGIPFPLVLFGTLRLGAVAVPISVREQTPGLAYMLSHSGARVLVHDADLAGRLPAQADVPALQHRVGVDAQAPWRQMGLLAESGSA